MKSIVVIPARYSSSRFPGKPLAKILDKPMIQWVYERCKKSKLISEVYVATDDQRIFDCVEKFGGVAIMTGECKCGTDRIYQAVKNIECDIVINVQGDEPTIDYNEIDSIVRAFDNVNINMVTMRQKIENSMDVCDPNIVKVISDNNENAIYFSRAPIPYNRDFNKIEYYRHIGIYGYRKDFLNIFVSLNESKLEKIEKLEQLRVIENGYQIKLLNSYNQSIGVDVPEQIRVVEDILLNEN